MEKNKKTRIKIEIPNSYEKTINKIGTSVSPNKIMTMWNTYVSPKQVCIINKLYSYNKWDEMFYSGQFCIPLIGVLTYIEKNID